MRGLSWRELNRLHREADAAMRRDMSPQAYLAHRHRLQPPAPSGRAKRAVARFTRLVREARACAGLDAEAWTLRQLRSGYRALLRVVRDRGGLWGEFARMCRAHTHGSLASAEFEERATWALRLLEGAEEGDP